MKKILIVILMSFIFINNIYADDINSFSCEYIVKNKDVNFKLIMDVTNYNKTNSTGDIKLQYENREGKMVTINESQSTYDVKGSNVSNEDLYRFFVLDKKFYQYLKEFDDSCQPLYLVNYKSNPTTYDIENNSVDPSLGKSTLIEVKNSTINANNVKQEEENNTNQNEESKTEEKKEENNNTNTNSLEPVELNIDVTNTSCEKILGPVLTKIVKSGITIVQIICAIIAIVNGMLLLVPAVVAKDADALKKASKKLAMMGIILALVIIFKPLVRLIANILEYDVSCIM